MDQRYKCKKTKNIVLLKEDTGEKSCDLAKVKIS